MIRNRLAQILDDGGLSTRVQAIIELGGNLSTDRFLYGVECLSRGPAGTLFESANVLFEYVRRKRAEVIIDRECIGLAFRSVKVLGDDLRLFLNVHRSTLGRDKWFAGFLQHQAEATGTALSRLTLEILEHDGESDRAVLLENVRLLKNMGVKFALDDVGLNHCNLGMMLDVSPEFLKLDVQLVRGCHFDPRRRAILRALQQVGRDLGARIIAEGAETAEELQVMADLGIRQIQGFHVLPPMRPQEFVETPWSKIAQMECDDTSAAPVQVMLRNGASPACVASVTPAP